MRGFLFLACAVAFGQPADLVLRNGKIVTMNAAQPAAQAIAVRGDRIVALGGNADAVKWIGPGTKVIDLHGMLAIPGFIEGHGHFTGLGEFRLGLDLRAAPVSEALRRIARLSVPPGRLALQLRLRPAPRW
jgi:predicted amidohydrolase YtcJ